MAAGWRALYSICMAGCHAQYQQTVFAKKKRHDVAILFGTARAAPSWRQVFNVPGVDEAGAGRPHWFAGCGMLLSIWSGCVLKRQPLSAQRRTLRRP